MNKETEQQTLREKVDAIKKQIETGLDGEITNVVDTTSKEFFGEENVKEDRSGIEVTILMSNDEELKQFFNTDIHPSGYQNSNLYKFDRKYGKLPEEGIKVHCKLNDDGFFKIDY